MGDLLFHVVDGDGELVGPESQAVPDQQVTALFVRTLHLRTLPQVIKADFRGLKSYAQGTARPVGQVFVGARPRVAQFAIGSPEGLLIGSPEGLHYISLHNTAGAPAGVDQALVAKALERGVVDRFAVALPHHGRVGSEPEPCKILDDRCLELRTRPLTVVILDAEQHSPTFVARCTPDMEGIDDVADVEMTGGCGRKTGEHGTAQRLRGFLI